MGCIFLKLFLNDCNNKLQVWKVVLSMLCLKSQPLLTALIIQASFCSSLEFRQLCLTSQGPFNLYHSGWNKSSGALSSTFYNWVWVVCCGGFDFDKRSPDFIWPKNHFLWNSSVARSSLVPDLVQTVITNFMKH